MTENSFLTNLLSKAEWPMIVWGGVFWLKWAASPGKYMYHVHAKDTVIDSLNAIVDGALDAESCSDVARHPRFMSYNGQVARFPLTGS